MSFVLEHAGDITHRGWQDFHLKNHGRLSCHYVDEKTDKVLYTLRNSFRRQAAANLRNNRVNIPEAKRALKRYADAHRRLPVYNRMQKIARDAAVALGEGRYELAAELLAILQANVNAGCDHWYQVATQYRLGRDGYPRKVG